MAIKIMFEKRRRKRSDDIGTEGSGGPRPS